MTTQESIADGLRPLVVIQRNPRSGTGRRRKELLILGKQLRNAGFVVRMFSNRARLDLYIAQITPSRQLRCIVAAGGDGTVADVVNRHPGVPIAILPLGTENLLACYLKIRPCGRSLAEMILRGQVRTLDSAKANGLRFLLMLSVGVDAEIVQCVHAARTGNISRYQYVWPTLRGFVSSRPVTYTATAADSSAEISGSHLIVTNVPAYGFQIPFAPGAIPDDGLLDVRALHCCSRWQIVWHAVRLRLGLPIAVREFSRFTAKAVTIRCNEHSHLLPTQCDGDPGVSLPVQIEVEPGSLTLIVP